MNVIDGLNDENNEVLSESKKQVPKVLILGNGLLKSFGGTVSWENLLEKLHCNDCVEYDDDFGEISYPLEAVLRTDNKLEDILKSGSEIVKKLDTRDVTPDLRERLERIIGCGFDHILTTNYGYEIETVAAEKNKITNYALTTNQHNQIAGERAETKYALHTCYEIGNQKIWHIHGEARKPSGIILGHYSYGKLLSKYCNHFENMGNIYYEKLTSKDKIPISSWLDAFILGDVYILGLGLDFSEMDLWWLINRKAREKADTGSLYFFEPENEGVNLKHRLLNCYGCDVVACGTQLIKELDCMDEKKKHEARTENSKRYRLFYDKAISTICDLMSPDE